MKISYAIVSADSNPYYLDFWPVVAKLWSEKFGITPVLGYVGVNPPKHLKDSGEIHCLEPVENIPRSFQAQWARFFLTQRYGEEIAIISDIDMLPLSSWYFIDQIADMHDNAYVHLYPCIDSYGHLPACYHVAKGNLFENVLNLTDGWQDSCQYVYHQKFGTEIRLSHLNDPT